VFPTTKAREELEETNRKKTQNNHRYCGEPVTCNRVNDSGWGEVSEEERK